MTSPLFMTLAQLKAYNKANAKLMDEGFELRLGKGYSEDKALVLSDGKPSDWLGLSKDHWAVIQKYSDAAKPQKWPKPCRSSDYKLYVGDYGDDEYYPRDLRSVPLINAMVTWNTCFDEEMRPVVLVLDRAVTFTDGPRGWATHGFSYGRDKTTPEKRLNRMFKLFHNLIYSYGFDHELVHQAFMVIPEYRDATRPYNP